MTTLASRAFAIATTERAVKTLAQTAVAQLGLGAVGVLDVDWTQLASVSLLAALISLLTSVASAGTGGTGPSLTHAETTTTALADVEVDLGDDGPDHRAG